MRKNITQRFPSKHEFKFQYININFVGLEIFRIFARQSEKQYP